MTVLRCATLGFALALGATGAHAQSVVTRHIDDEPVETVVTHTPGATVITRRPLAAVPAAPSYVAPASTTYMDETVGAAPDVRTSTRTTRRVVRHTRRATIERSVTHAVHTARRVARSRPLVLAPVQRHVIYRTLVQERVVPQVAPPPMPPPGYPPFPPPAAVAPVTTGYAVAAPAEVVEDEDDAGYAAPVATAYRVGAVLPASVAVAPVPESVAVAVPAAEPYSYATVDGRVLLVDPVTNSVVADITP